MTREDLDDGCMRTEKLRSSIVWPGHPPVAFLEAPAGVRSQKGDGWRSASPRARRDRPVLRPDLPQPEARTDGDVKQSVNTTPSIESGTVDIHGTELTAERLAP